MSGAKMARKKIPSFNWLMAIMLAYIRLLLWRLLGERTTRKVLDLGRRMIGLPAVWSVEKDL